MYVCTAEIISILAEFGWKTLAKILNSADQINGCGSEVRDARRH